MQRLSLALAVMAITSTAHAQNELTNGTSSAVVQGEITIHTVTVGKIPNAYDPPSVLAVPGDIISFEFWASNHSVIRAAYAANMEPDRQHHITSLVVLRSTWELHRLSPGAIAGIVVGGVVALVAFAALLLMYCRTNSSKAERRRLRDNSAPRMQSNGEMAGFMTAHNGNYDGAQLPPYQSPVMRHPEFKEMADSRANEVPMGPNMREGPSFSFGQDRDADQHRFSNTSELSGLQSPQELPTMHEIFTPGTIYRNAASPPFS
ncbi:hypothetical protein LTR48_005757 [Friedmanniomyces endolithicus]|uniref:Plastocyanin-like domain-containing protein n=1 Tax=Rachicladosporium monterosium TaxID=1507873 RepID=A0ABR0L161_9PEZI|nr:hypothetical protein LTR48_005757 [Friedmanniomyces endolithicus]KAK5141875.1 hypothetical protein LTR32_005668 [Rachicladosporium monterosium]